jgi:LPS export ABC transporter permease LptG/LPS export ABC transporter permease LptF
MALLVGLLVACGRLSADREYVALQACGIGLARLLRPAAALATVACVVTAYVNLAARPAANHALRERARELLEESASRQVKPRVFFEGFPGLVLYVRDVSADGWRQVFLADRVDNSHSTLYVAERGRLDVDPGRRQARLTLEDGTAHTTFSDNRELYDLGRFEELSLPLDWDALFPARLAKHPDEMSLAELTAYVTDLARRRAATTEPMFEYHERFAIPAACLVFGVLGITLGMTTRRDGKLASFVLGAAVVFIYYALLFASKSLALGGRLPASLASWVPNLVLGLAGALMLRNRAAARLSGLPARRLASLVTARPPGSTVSGSGWWSAPDLVARLPCPRVLDRYVARLFLRVYALTFLVLVGIFYLEMFIDRSGSFFRGTTTTRMIVAYYWNSTPQLAYYSIPLAVLIATLVTIGILTRTSELIVMKACGVSLYRTVAPIVVAAAAGGLVVFLLQERVLALANRRAEALRHVMDGEPESSAERVSRTWTMGHDGTLYTFHRFDAARGEFERLAIFEIDLGRWRLLRSTFASGATYEPRRDGPQNLWRVHDARVWEVSDADLARPAGPPASRLMALEPIAYFRSETLDTELMSYNELRRYVTTLGQSGFNMAPHAVALQRKLSFPFVTLIMTLLAVPFGVAVGRHGTVYGVGAGVLLAYAHWAASSVFAAVGTAGGLPPLPAAWVPDFLFGAVAGYLVLRVRT